ncbi:MAG TPA: cytochrome C [Gammaproteobacteria bacterium]|nr:cytochrome C [Gammaproteobacteria bacterium]
MKSLSLLIAVGATVFSMSSMAAPDEDAAMKLAKDSGCTKCHSVDKTKKGPAYQKTAAKFKGKADAESKIYDSLTKPHKVKFEDGTEEEHKLVKSKDEAQIRNLVQWILAQ